MTREELIEVMARAICEATLETGRTDWGGPIPAPDYYGASRAALAAIEASGVRLVPVGTPTQLIDGDERTTVRIFTPYAPTSPGAITGIRKAETPCSDCIDGWCQMNCGPKVG